MNVLEVTPILEPLMNPAVTLASGAIMLGILFAATGSLARVEAAEAWQASFARDEYESGDTTLRYRLFTPPA